MARLTKNSLIEELQQIFEKHELINNQLHELIDNGIVEGGAIYVYGLHHSYPFKWLYGFKEGEKTKLYGNGKKITKLSEYKMMFRRASEELAEAEKFLNENKK